MLHCSLSELEDRCPEIADMEFAAAYLNRKDELQSEQIKGAR